MKNEVANLVDFPTYPEAEVIADLSDILEHWEAASASLSMVP